MNWKEEETQTSRITKESLQKRFIKEELMRYYFYLGRAKDIKAEIEEFKIEYEEELNNPVFGGSIIQMPNGISEKEHIVIRLNARLKDMEDNLKYYIKQDGYIRCVVELHNSCPTEDYQSVCDSIPVSRKKPRSY